jgi:hypothetical protein
MNAGEALLSQVRLARIRLVYSSSSSVSRQYDFSLQSGCH